ncbi:hypothetical protein P5V15_015382 [Pogonomyrmex californicus]
MFQYVTTENTNCNEYKLDCINTNKTFSLAFLFSCILNLTDNNFTNCTLLTNTTNNIQSSTNLYFKNIKTIIKKIRYSRKVIFQISMIKCLHFFIFFLNTIVLPLFHISKILYLYNALKNEESNRTCFGEKMHRLLNLNCIIFFLASEYRNVCHRIRKTNKKNCCFYCKKLQSKIARHLETVHYNEEEVKKFAILPKGNFERKKIIETIRRNDNFQFNTKRAINNGELIVCRRPNKKLCKSASNFLPCVKCKGFFSKSSLCHHFRRCTGRNSKHSKSIMVLGRTIVIRTHEVANKILKTVVFPILRDDEITRAIRYDQLIILYGNKLCLKLQHQHDMIRSRLRLLGRYLVTLRTKSENISDFASLYDPKFYDVAIAAVNSIAGFDENKNIYKTPSVAFNLGTYMKHIGEIFITECIKNHDPIKMKAAKNFLKLLRQDYGTSINRIVLETQMQRKRQKKIILPSTEDIRKLNDYLMDMRQKAYNNLMKEYSYRNWLILLETTLISMQLFNRRRAGETERIQISEFKNYHYIYKSLSTKGRRLAKKYIRFEIRGKLGRTVPVLFHSDLLKCINVILNFRSDAKVHHENSYLFGIPGCDKKRYKYLRACNLMRTFSEACGASMPHTLRGTQLRKHIATKCISLNLLEHQVDDLSNHLGHTDKIHKEHYRLPVASRDILQVSKLLEYAQGEEDNEDESSDDNGMSSPYGPTKRIRWNEEEKNTVLSAFTTYFDNEKLPSLKEINNVIQNSPCLKSRTAPQIKTWLYNQRKSRILK